MSHKYLLGTYFVLGIVLGAAGTYGIYAIYRKLLELVSFEGVKVSR